MRGEAPSCNYVPRGSGRDGANKARQVDPCTDYSHAGFSAAGGALAATAAFLCAFLLYHATVVPQEEAMLLTAFGEEYEAYRLAGGGG